jgi:hypothetical protein
MSFPSPSFTSQTWWFFWSASSPVLIWEIRQLRWWNNTVVNITMYLPENLCTTTSVNLYDPNDSWDQQSTYWVWYYYKCLTCMVLLIPHNHVEVGITLIFMPQRKEKAQKRKRSDLRHSTISWCNLDSKVGNWSAAPNCSRRPLISPGRKRLILGTFQSL